MRKFSETGAHDASLVIALEVIAWDYFEKLSSEDIIGRRYLKISLIVRPYEPEKPCGKLIVDGIN